MKVVGHLPDLMDRTRWAAVTHVADPEQLVDAGADLVVVDLDRLPSLEVLGRIPAPTLGFCSHIDEERMAAARAAGCDEVVPRSRLGRVLGERLGSGSGVPGPDGGG